MLVTSTSCSGAPGTVALPPRSQMLSKTLSPGPSPEVSFSIILLGETSSVPRDLHASTTRPTLASVHRCVLAPAGSRVTPSPAARGLSRRGSPCSGLPAHRRGPTGWVGAHSPGHTASWTAACLSKAHVQALAQLRLCPLPFPPADMPAPAQWHRHLPGAPSQEGFSVDASTRHWQKRGPDLQISPAHFCH